MMGIRPDSLLPACESGLWDYLIFRRENLLWVVQAFRNGFQVTSPYITRLKPNDTFFLSTSAAKLTGIHTRSSHKQTFVSLTRLFWFVKINPFCSSQSSEFIHLVIPHMTWTGTLHAHRALHVSLADKCWWKCVLGWTTEMQIVFKVCLEELP